MRTSTYVEAAVVLVLSAAISLTQLRADIQNFSIGVGDAVSDGVPLPGAGNIEVPGAKDVYTFAGTAGQTVDFDDQSIGWTGLCWTLYDPDGNNLWSNWLYGSHGPGRYTLTKTGSYHIEVGWSPWGSPATTGTYAFKLWLVADQTFAIAIGDTVSDGFVSGASMPGAGNIEVPGAKDIYTFAGTAGQTVCFDDQSPTPVGLYWTLYDPDGLTLWSDYLDGNHGPGRYTLPKTGTYHIQAWYWPGGTFAATGGYGFKLWPVADQTFPIASGTALTVTDGAINGETALGAGNIETPGAKDIYTFTGTAGQTICFDDQSAASVGLYWTLYDPDGFNLWSDSLDGNHGPGRYTLTKTGAYRLEAWYWPGGTFAATGSYAFRPFLRKC